MNWIFFKEQSKQQKFPIKGQEKQILTVALLPLRNDLTRTDSQMSLSYILCQTTNC